MRFLSIIDRVHKDCTLAEKVTVLFQQQVADGEHERMTGMEHGSEGGAGFVERADSFFGKADALVAFKNRGEVAAVAAGDEAVTLADGGRDVGDLESPGLSRVNCATQRFKSFHKERTNEIRLKATCLSFFHLLLHRKKALGTHCFLGQSVAFKDGPKVIMIKGILDGWLSRARTSGWSP